MSTKKSMQSFMWGLDTSCTIDRAIDYLMGWPVDQAPYPEGATDEDIESYDSSNCITEIMDNLEGAEIDYNELKTKASLAEVTKYKGLLEEAHNYRCLIRDELAKGSESILRVDKLATINDRYPLITIISFDNWVSKNNFIVDADDVGAPQLSLNDDEVKTIGLEAAEVKGILIIMLFIVNTIANDKGKYKHKNKNNRRTDLKVDVFAKEIERHCVNNIKEPYRKGLSVSSITTRINMSVDVGQGNEEPGAFMLRESDSLKCILASLVEILVIKKGTGWDFEKIMKMIKAQLQEPSHYKIEELINDAMEAWSGRKLQGTQIIKNARL
mgnify:CR=1 FL=1